MTVPFTIWLALCSCGARIARRDVARRAVGSSRGHSSSGEIGRAEVRNLSKKGELVAWNPDR